MADTSPDAALGGPWTAYRIWACTAAHHKGTLDRLTRWSLWLCIAGAVLVALGQQLAPLAPEGKLDLLLKAPGVLGAIAVALAGYFSQLALADDRMKTWTRARSGAESLKAGIFLYRVSAPPFDRADRATQLRLHVEKVLAELKDVESRPSDGKAEPAGRLTIEQYVKERVDDQIEWYEKRSGEHRAEADRFRTATAVLSGISAVLVLASAVAAVAAWVAVIATIVASITAHLKSQQYQMLAAVYQSTALRLRLAKSEWASTGKADADTAVRNAFVRQCEDTMASESGAWSALWERKPAEASPAV